MRKITKVRNLLALTLLLAFISPSIVMAKSGTSSCIKAQAQTVTTQKTVRTLKQHQQQLQQEVRRTYQKIFICQAQGDLSPMEQRHCVDLHEEGPRQFQAMIQAITLHHQASQQLAHQTHQTKLVCHSGPEDLQSQHN